jgi:hypothetical protein
MVPISSPAAGKCCSEGLLKELDERCQDQSRDDAPEEIRSDARTDDVADSQQLGRYLSRYSRALIPVEYLVQGSPSRPSV